MNNIVKTKLFETCELFTKSRLSLIKGICKAEKSEERDILRTIAWFDEILLEDLFHISFKNYGTGRETLRNTLMIFINDLSRGVVKLPSQPELYDEKLSINRYKNAKIKRNYDFAISKIIELMNICENESYKERIEIVYDKLKLIELILHMNQINDKSIQIIKNDLLRIFKLLKRSGYDADERKIYIKTDQFETTRIKLPMNYVEIIK